MPFAVSGSKLPVGSSAMIICGLFTIALAISLAVVVILDIYNPMMGFLIGAPFLVLALCSGVCSIAVCIVLYRSWRKPRKKHREKCGENAKTE